MPRLINLLTARASAQLIEKNKRHHGQPCGEVEFTTAAGDVTVDFDTRYSAGCCDFASVVTYKLDGRRIASAKLDDLLGA